MQLPAIATARSENSKLHLVSFNDSWGRLLCTGTVSTQYAPVEGGEVSCKNCQRIVNSWNGVEPRTENTAYFEMLDRMVGSLVKRVVNGNNEVDVAKLLAFQAKVDRVVTEAVIGMKEADPEISWATIAMATGTSRQAAFKKYTRKAQSTITASCN